MKIFIFDDHVYQLPEIGLLSSQFGKVVLNKTNSHRIFEHDRKMGVPYS